MVDISRAIVKARNHAEDEVGPNSGTVYIIQTIKGVTITAAYRGAAIGLFCMHACIVSRTPCIQTILMDFDPNPKSVFSIIILYVIIVTHYPVRSRTCRVLCLVCVYFAASSRRLNLDLTGM